MAGPDETLAATSGRGAADGTTLGPEGPGSGGADRGEPGDSDAADPFAAGAVLGSRYQTIRLLGEGGMGTAVLARDLRLGRLVVVKAPQPRWLASAEARHAFVREAQGMSRVEHPNVVDIRDVGQHRGLPYLVQEYVDGPPLDAWYAGQRGDPRARVGILIQLVRGVAAAHGRGVLHLDLKPANAIVRADDGTLKILDFGLCVLQDMLSEGGQWPPGGSVRGTPGFMSPAQWRGEPPTEGCDVWAVGCIAYHLATGQLPFGGTTASAIRQRVLSDDDVPSVSQRAPWVPEGLCELVSRCMRRDAAARPESAAALLDALQAVESELTVAGHVPAPYRGLLPFRGDDASVFFGREPEVSALLGWVRDRAVVAVVGPSGAGKSSLVAAGVLPRLRDGPRPWCTLTVQPGRHPFRALAAALDREVTCPNPAEGATETALRAAPGALGVALRDRAAQHGAPVLLLVDQAEELCTLTAELGERRAFVDAIRGAADVPEAPVRVVLCLREDFLTPLADLGLRASFRRGLFLLGAMGDEALRSAVCEPAARFGYAVEDAVADAIVTAVSQQRSALPLLQFVCSELWDRRNEARRLLGQEAFEALGGLSGALSRHADAVIGRLEPGGRGAARDILCRLVTSDGTRAVVERSEVVGALGERAEPVLDALIAGRLVQARESGGEAPDTVLELVHEALITGWQQLGVWLDQRSEAARLRDRVSEAAREWDRRGRPGGLLWTGEAAAEVSRWRLAHGLPLGPRDGAFVAAVEAARSHGLRRRRRVRIAVGSLLALVTLVSTTAAVWIRAAERQARAAERQQHALRVRAEAREREARSKALAAQARESLHTAPMRALLLAREAMACQPTVEARQALSDALAVSFERVRIQCSGDPATVVFSPGARRLLSSRGRRAFLADLAERREVALDGHSHPIRLLAFLPDGQVAVTAARDGAVRLWDPDGTERAALAWDRSYRSLAFSPDGTLMLPYGGRTAQLVSLDGETLGMLVGHDGEISRAAFSPAGDHILTVSRQPERGVVDGMVATGAGLRRSRGDGTARVWDRGGTLVLSIREPAGNLWDASFGPNGRILTASGDGTVRVWGPSGQRLGVVEGREPGTLTTFAPGGQLFLSAPPKGPATLWTPAGERLAVIDRVGAPGALPFDVFEALFSPDGRWILTRSGEQMDAWSLTGVRLATLRAPDPLRRLAIDRAGSRVMTSGNDAARIWDIGDPPPLLHPTEVSRVAFSPDGRTLLAASADKAVTLWGDDGRTRRMLRGDTAETAVFRFPLQRAVGEIDPSGARVVTASGDTALLWSPDGQRRARLTGHTGEVVSAHFDRAGTALVTGSRDGTARVWSADGVLRAVLRGHRRGVLTAVFGPRGARVLTGSADGTARLWTALGQPLATLAGHEQGAIRAVAFSPDGTRLATGPSYYARLWDDRGKLIAVLRSQTGAITSLAFSPDSARLLTASGSGTAWLWDRSGAPVAALRGHESAVEAARFSPDGRRIVTVSRDGSARIWDAEGRPVLTLRGHTGPLTDGVFDASGARVLTASRDGMLRLHHVADRLLMRRARTRASRGLTAAERDQYLGGAGGP